MNLSDWSGNTWVTTFSSEGEKILGMTSQELGDASEQGQGALDNIVSKANFKEFIFKCRAKHESYNVSFCLPHFF